MSVIKTDYCEYVRRADVHARRLVPLWRVYGAKLGYARLHTDVTHQSFNIFLFNNLRLIFPLKNHYKQQQNLVITIIIHRDLRNGRDVYDNGTNQQVKPRISSLFPVIVCDWVRNWYNATWRFPLKVSWKTEAATFMNYWSTVASPDCVKRV